jgi:hypothetical protein
MKFDPVSDEEYKGRGQWAEDWYSAMICTHADAVTEGTSKGGNRFFKVQIDVFNGSGATKRITAVIMVDGHYGWQFRSAAEAFGVLDKYHAGELGAEDLKGREGWVQLGIEKDPEGKWPDKNRIVDYRPSLSESSGEKELPF